MAAMRPESANPLQTGPEVYAPSNRRVLEDPINGAHVAVTRQTVERPQPNEVSNAHLDALIRRLADSSMDEIDNVIRELERMRELLRNEGERISRDIVGYAGLSQASMAAVKILSDSLEIWKDRPERSA
jgi:hypothetical protein